MPQSDLRVFIALLPDNLQAIQDQSTTFTAFRSQRAEGASMQEQIAEFFSTHDEANNRADMAGLAKLYADRFLFAGPNSVTFVERDAFLKILPMMKAKFSAMGVKERRVRSVEASLLDSKYFLAKVAWNIGVENSSEKRHVEVKATFLLTRDEQEQLSIIAQIDHQDLSRVLAS